MLIDRGFNVDNYVGTYHIEDNETIGARMIVSEEFNRPTCDEIPLKKKQIFSFDSSDKFLFLELANLNISRDEDILSYCNKYGLPYSSQVCTDAELGLASDVAPLAKEIIKIGRAHV